MYHKLKVILALLCASAVGTAYATTCYYIQASVVCATPGMFIKNGHFTGCSTSVPIYSDAYASWDNTVQDNTIGDLEAVGGTVGQWCRPATCHGTNPCTGMPETPVELCSFAVNRPIVGNSCH